MNGGVVKIFGDFPFMLSLVEAFLRFFSRIKKQDLTRFATATFICDFGVGGAMSSRIASKTP
jgi:hypothetical protein